MQYQSTRGAAPVVGFEDALLAGLAPDRGLYVPSRLPILDASARADLRALSYAEAAARIVSIFTEDAFSHAELQTLCSRAYGRFASADPAPVRALGGEDYLLELFHGPTLAFKDFAMQLLGELFDAVLARRDQRLTILAATSGDTGAAAIEAFRNCDRVRTVVLHPTGRVTDVQRRMMTCVDAPNVLNIAVNGSFDDCQRLVKTFFADDGLRRDARLGGVNSINWARIAAQTVYYFTAHSAVAGLDEPVSFAVPTGNFGDVFAGYIAKQLGLPVGRLVVATNSNDILRRAMTTGDYAPHGAMATLSPSMDIQVASNFERLLFDLMDRDGAALAARMTAFEESKSLQLSPAEIARIAEGFAAYAVSEEETIAKIREIDEVHGVIIDPHTAVGLAAARHARKDVSVSGKVVTLATAHPAKFPDAVIEATGKPPVLPAHYADLFERDEHYRTLDADAALIGGVIREFARG